MKSSRLIEIKNIIRQTLNEINQSDPEWEELQLNRQPYTANVGDADVNDTGSFSVADIETVAVSLFKELSEQSPNLKAIHDLLDTGELNTGYGKAILSNGNEDDSVPVVDGTFKISEAEPTQANIWFFKSVLFGVSDVKWKTSANSLKDNATASPALKVNFAEMGGRTFILDGHHRWSGQFAFGEPNHSMAGLNFQFPTAVINRALAALQVGIASNVSIGTPLPSAGPPKSKNPINCYTQDAKQLAEALHKRIGVEATSLDPKANGSILSEEWMAMTMSNAGTEFKGWVKRAIQNHGALESAGINVDKLKADLGNTTSGGQDGAGTEEMSRDVSGMTQEEVLFAAMAENTGIELSNCPLRKVICHEIGRRYSSLPKPDSAVVSTDRKDMPQLDGATGPEDADGETPELEPQDLADQLSDGSVNWEIQYSLPDENNQNQDEEDVNESIDIRRWNKLAGLLKD
jgi:hypothetical protein